MRFCRQIAHFFLERIIDVLSWIKNMSFPSKYDWRMRLEMLSSRFENGTAVLCKNVIKPGMFVIDIGAHIGFYSRLFSKLVGKFGKVLAFEPEPSNFKLLKKNIKGYENIKEYFLAVSDNNKFIDFYISKEKSGCHSVFPSDFRTEKISVRAVKLDSFLHEAGIDGVDLIKIDIEGGEIGALDGMDFLLNSNQKIMMIIEYCPQNLLLADISTEQFFKKLFQLKFKIYIIKDDGALDEIDFNEYKIKINEWFKSGGEEYVNLFCRR